MNAQVKQDQSTENKAENCTQTFLVNSDGKLLYCLRWQPTGVVRALVFLSHGFGEHIEYYRELAELLVKENYLVFAHDHIGHGRSEGIRAHISQIDDYVRDLFQHVDLIKSRNDAQLPIFIVGHSMGGTIAIKAAMQRPNFFKGIVLVAPGVMLNPETATPAKIFFAKLLSKILPQCPISPLKINFITRDNAEIERMKNDHLRYHGGVKAKWSVAFLDALQEINNNLTTIEWPFLVVHGSNDLIIDIAGSRQLHELANSKDKTLKVYGGAYHNLLHDIQEIRVRTLADICSWIRERTNHCDAK